MVDGAAIEGNFSAVPRGGFEGDGAELSLDKHVVWDPAAGPKLEVHLFGNGATIKLQDHVPAQLNIAPVIGGVALLGEAGKVAAVSTYRFASIAAAATTGAGGQRQGAAATTGSANGHGVGVVAGLEVTVRGVPGESVQVLFATAAAAGSGFEVHTKAVAVGPAGTVTVTLPENAGGTEAYAQPLSPQS